MNDSVITAVIGVVTAIITGWFTNRTKNKEIDLIRDSNQKEIQSLKEKHQHDKEMAEAKHTHELEIMEKEIQTKLEYNNQSAINDLVFQQFLKGFGDVNSPINGFFESLIEDEMRKQGLPPKK